MKVKYSEKFLKRKIKECTIRVFEEEEDKQEKLDFINDAIAYLEILEEQIKDGV